MKNTGKAVVLSQFGELGFITCCCHFLLNSTINSHRNSQCQYQQRWNNNRIYLHYADIYEVLGRSPWQHVKGKQPKKIYSSVEIGRNFFAQHAGQAGKNLRHIPSAVFMEGRTLHYAKHSVHSIFRMFPDIPKALTLTVQLQAWNGLHTYLIW